MTSTAQLMAAIGFAVVCLPHGEAQAQRSAIQPYAFTETQLSMLANHGCYFDALDLDTMMRLHARGFHADTVVSAYIDVHEMMPGRRQHLETAATLIYLGLERDTLPAIAGANPNVTRYYNRRFGRGAGAFVPGLIIAPLALIVAGIGVAMNQGAMDDDPEDFETPEEHRDQLAFRRDFGGVMAGVSAAVASAGIFMAIYGGIKRSRRAPRQLLDDGHVRDLAPYRQQKRAKSVEAVSLRWAPAALNRGAGLQMALEF